jgi:two-component system cell cycle sensor histidine kinase/response regulator CckA
VKDSEKSQERLVPEPTQRGDATVPSQGAQPPPEPEHRVALRLGQAHLRLALGAARVTAWQWDVQTNAVVWSEGAEEIFGVEPDDFGGTFESYLDHIYADDRPRVVAAVQHALSDDIPFLVEHRIQLGDGSVRWLVGRGNVLRDPDGNPVRMAGITADITERKEAEERLRESEERFRAFSESSFEAIAFGYRGRVVDANDACLELLGYSADELIGQEVTKFVAQEDLELVASKMRSGFAKPYEHRALRKDGSVVHVEATGRSVVYRGLECRMTALRDITERKRMEAEQERLEAQLRQAQRIEAVGELAGGIAHDFNNLLMGIQGRASLMSVDLGKDHPHVRHVSAIEAYIRSAADLTNQLLGFARGGKYEVRPIDMNQLLGASAAMFGRTRKEIRIHTRLREPPPVVSADRRQIEQVFLNLFVNAWQAMPSGGELFLETRTLTLDEAFCRPHQAVPGRYVKIVVTDTGVGMSESIRQRIFDPFFTTKGQGRGTGLGLASAYGIIKNHGGIITVSSEVGHGATFAIYLPLTDGAPEAERTAPSRLHKGSEFLLLVDDEEMILEVGRAMLETLGYRVLVAKDGKEALAAVAREQGRIDLVILDLIMPGSDGGMVFDRIREIDPAMPVILSSGYSLNGQAQQIIQRGCNGFIQKPFNISELSQKIRKVLDPV